MKVSDLVAALQQWPQDRLVCAYMGNDNQYMVPVGSIVDGLVYAEEVERGDTVLTPGPADDETNDFIRVVVIRGA